MSFVNTFFDQSAHARVALFSQQIGDSGSFIKQSVSSINQTFTSTIPHFLGRLCDRVNNSAFLKAGNDTDSPPAHKPSTTDQALEVAGDAVEVTVDVLQFMLALVIGAAIGFALGLLAFAIARVVLSKRPELKIFLQKVFSPFEVIVIVIGAWAGLNYYSGRTWANSGAMPRWIAATEHAFLIAVIISGTWLVARILTGVIDLIHNRIEESSARKALRVQTQLQILHRVILLAVWILGLAGVVLTFPGARAAGVSLLASAGLVSVVAGLAAQSVLGNVFAGLQLAFSDSIRVGDLVQYEGQTATVEEITLTYVVLSIWDGRRVIVPSSSMTTKAFENWTRRAPEMTGTVEWEVDWSLPINAARKQFDYLLSTSDLWNGDVGVLQISNAVDGRLTMCALVSADDYGSLVDLKNYVREHMVQWIQKEAPQAMPHYRSFEAEALDLSEATRASEQAVSHRLTEETPVLYVPESASASIPRTDSTQIISPTEMHGIIAPSSAESGSATVVFGKDAEGEQGLEHGAENLDGVAHEHSNGAVATKADGDVPHEDSRQGRYAREAISSAVSRRSGTVPGSESDKHTDDGGDSEQNVEVRRVSVGVALGQNIAGMPRVVFNEEPHPTRSAPGHESSIFSGSPQAEARRKSMEGPGEDVYLEREERLRKAQEARDTADAKARQHENTKKYDASGGE